ncbi:type II toxin-antitoxin system VapC family toxin [Adlercreutzia sp. ZJ138]|uniref:type II toxin-antitoxin system VapC family toxin n=1 Tax=Adlercreutzia sp. ZJ138 TaxID=2709405 RepID=UPI0013EA481F|nr:type II toxin-antitoxin system VapC family toxin [Adlercreutzia sp. ZJ138]
MYLLDSDTCIEIMRGHLPYAYKVMKSKMPSDFGVPSIVEAELRFGAEKSGNPREGRFLVDRFLAPLQVVPFDSRCAVQYAAVRHDLQKRGCMIGPNDLLIAATALAHGATLVSNNIREFSRVKGLLLECWDEVEL